MAKDHFVNKAQISV